MSQRTTASPDEKLDAVRKTGAPKSATRSKAAAKAADRSTPPATKARSGATTVSRKSSADERQGIVGQAAAQERQRIIAEAAYFRAQRRGFLQGGEIDDWLAAEMEMDALFNSGRPG